MKFVLDENFPCSAVPLLVELGHDAVDYITGNSRAGFSTKR